MTQRCDKNTQGSQRIISGSKSKQKKPHLQYYHTLQTPDQSQPSSAAGPAQKFPGPLKSTTPLSKDMLRAKTLPWHQI